MKGHRYRRKGWFGESYRHYLASKGISTKPSYFNQKKESIFGPNHKFEGMGEEVRRRDIMKKKEEVLNELDDAVRDKDLTGENREFFMKRHFRKIAEDYMNGAIDKEQFDKDMDVKLNHFMKTHSRKLPIFKMMEGKVV